MKPKIPLLIIIIISIAGMLFSGYLSYGELFQKSCPLGSCSSIAGIPVCVISFAIFLLVFILSILSLKNIK